MSEAAIPRVPRLVFPLVDRAVRVQQPAVAAYVERLRRRRPDATPAEIVETIERQFLAAVTSTGAAIGGTATVPGIGTVSALALSAGETVAFLETSAVFVLGAEGRGLRPRVRSSCDQEVSIPLGGRIDSLNVSTAAAVLLFEARRQRGGG